MNIAIAPVPAHVNIAGVDAVCDPLGALYIAACSCLVVSDLHLEKGAAFARRGMMLPPYDTLSTLRLLETVLSRHNPRMVISLGDNFHDRKGSALMPEEWRQRIHTMASGRDWIWINGNHDPDGTCNLPGVSTDELCLGGLTFRHEPGQGMQKGEIAGHLHPAATIRRREKSVRRPCFATDGQRLVMPSFGVLTGGLDLSHAAFRGLFREQDLVAHMLSREKIYSVHSRHFHG